MDVKRKLSAELRSLLISTRIRRTARVLTMAVLFQSRNSHPCLRILGSRFAPSLTTHRCLSVTGTIRHRRCAGHCFSVNRSRYSPTRTRPQPRATWTIRSHMRKVARLGKQFWRIWVHCREVFTVQKRMQVGTSTSQSLVCTSGQLHSASGTTSSTELPVIADICRLKGNERQTRRVR